MTSFLKKKYLISNSVFLVYCSDVKMGEIVSHVQKFTPKLSGDRKIVVTFSSNELVDVVGSKQVSVRD